MKNLLKNIFAMTGFTLVLLAMIASLYGAKFLFISSVYQSFGVNVVIYLGLKIVQRFESKYFFIETILNVTLVLCVLIPAGYFFGWYSSTPLWVVVLMSLIIYTVSCLADILRVNDDISYINKQLKNNEEVK